MITLEVLKVGIVSCSGEGIPGGTLSRFACRKVLDELRPAETVTICLPLFLAGGEGDRAFARFHPTITIDGCELRCAARATEMYSAKPAASLVVNELVAMATDLAEFLGAALGFNLLLGIPLWLAGLPAGASAQAAG